MISGKQVLMGTVPVSFSFPGPATSQKELIGWVKVFEGCYGLVELTLARPRSDLF